MRLVANGQKREGNQSGQINHSYHVINLRLLPATQALECLQRFVAVGKFNQYLHRAGKPAVGLVARPTRLRDAQARPEF